MNYGQIGGHWIAPALYKRDILKETLPDRFEHIDLWDEIARSCFMWWAFDTHAVMVNRPSAIYTEPVPNSEDELRLHNDDGPALLFRDNVAGYWVHGVRIPAWVFEQPELLTYDKIIAEENAEVRRVMRERYGYTRFITDADALLLDEDVDGLGLPRKLWRIPAGPNDREDIVMVQVTNSTPEPDGSFKEYWLRVPPNTGTCRGAAAWTFGVDVNEYVPIIET
jgi:hypothetical protein